MSPPRGSSRREFLKQCAVLGTGAALGLARTSLAAGRKRPNLVYIFTDQQSASMMSCAGNGWLETPALDYIARNGIRFDRAYSTNPVCVPARIGMMTGRFPGDFSSPGGQVRENHGGMRVPDISRQVQQTNIAAFLRSAGYELAYGGKTHLPRPLLPEKLGFEVVSRDQRDKLARACADYIRRKHDKPYYLVASFINPHDICYMALRGLSLSKTTLRRAGRAEKKLLEAMRLPEGVGKDPFFSEHCPPLPPNFEPQRDEPEAIRWLLRARGFRMRARTNYTEEDWRLHRWAYHRLTEVVDRQIQVVLDALRDSGQEENTVVVFSSDHGDMDAAHRMEHKTALYEEAARIPFIVMHKGGAPAIRQAHDGSVLSPSKGAPGGRVDTKHLVSNGLDLLPTLCDYAGIEGRADPRGRSLRPIIEGKPPPRWRKTLGVESEIGRMVVGEACKYVRYDRGADQEQILDLGADPNETRHFTDEESHAGVLAELRGAFEEEWFPGV